jgi:hypothetical protein
LPRMSRTTKTHATRVAIIKATPRRIIEMIRSLRERTKEIFVIAEKISNKRKGKKSTPNATSKCLRERLSEK